MESNKKNNATINNGRSLYYEADTTLPGTTCDGHCGTCARNQGICSVFGVTVSVNNDCANVAQRA